MKHVPQNRAGASLLRDVVRLMRACCYRILRASVLLLPAEFTAIEPAIERVRIG